ncbi:MAG: polysaccharide biosynthesis/export family protein [Holophagales bacterium]|nr:MAG: polysaccharide biosynthesis/export family protein [Holophagales bacterium]
MTARCRWRGALTVGSALLLGGCAAAPPPATTPTRPHAAATPAPPATPPESAAAGTIPAEKAPPAAIPAPPRLTGPVLPQWESIEAARGAGPGIYLLWPSDVVDIMVVGHEDLRKELPVRPDGRISYTYLGDLQAAGISTDELRTTIEEGLKKYLRHPQVTVVLKKARDAQYAILGKVVRPGVYPINGPVTIITAVAEAQGLASGQYEGSTIEVADLQNSYLVRRGKVVPVDFEALIHRGDTTQDVRLEDGDYIYLPSALAQEVYVLGEVFKPRSYGFRGRVTLLQAVAESGGFRPTARLGDVAILRGQYGRKELIPVDVKSIIGGKLADPELAVGDVVYVPRSRLASVAEVFNQIMPGLLAVQLGRSF